VRPALREELARRRRRRLGVEVDQVELALDLGQLELRALLAPLGPVGRLKLSWRWRRRKDD